MSIGRRLRAAIALIAVFAIPAAALAAPITISGDVTLTTAGPSGGNRLVVKLLEHTSSGATIQRAGVEKAIATTAYPPYHFDLPADNATLNTAGSAYSLQATIALNTSIRFQDSVAYTPGSTAAIVIPIKPATGNLPYGGTGDWLLLIVLLLFVLAALLAGWRWLRMRPLARQLA